jgi:hypothetical protein
VVTARQLNFPAVGTSCYSIHAQSAPRHEKIASPSSICQPRPPQVLADKQLTPTEKKFADAQEAFLDHVGQLWNANLESNYRRLIPGTVSVELSTSPEGQLVKASVLSNTSNELAAQLIIDAIRPAIRFLATGKSSKITAEVTAFAAEGGYFGPHDKRPVANVRVSQGGLHYPYETGACFSFTDLSGRHSIWDRDH